MNLNNGEEKEEVDLKFTQHCLELAKLFRTDQPEAFLRLYDSLPSEWNGSRLETAKETIRQYQELDENDFQSLYQRAFDNMSKQSLNDQVHSLSFKKTNDETTRRFQPITNNRTPTSVDSFVQLNLKPDINIRVEDYKKAIDTMPITKSSSTNNRSVNLSKQHYRSHQDASFDYFSPQHDEQHSRSSSSSSSSTTTTTRTNPQKDLYKHGKFIETHDFDSHGSSITTKSSSENSESIRTASGSDSDEGEKKPLLANTKSKLYLNETKRNHDDTLTLVLNQTSDHQTSQHDLKLTLPEQNSYELVKSPTSTDPPSLLQLPRFKQPANDDPNGLNHSNNELPSYTTQRSPLNNSSIPSSSHQTRNSERHEQHNTNHSNSSRKSATRIGKKRKQLQQQEIIRTELIPGHRGGLDVDELVMFIDGQSSTKQRQNSSSIRTLETNSNQTNTSKRKSRKSSKILQDNETKLSNHDDDEDINNNNSNNNNNIDFLDEHHSTNTTQTHSFDEQIHPDDDDESHSNTTNGEISLPEWHNTSSNNDEFDSLSLSSLTLNNSNSEVVSEPFVTVSHRRRSIKERRQETNNNNSNSSTNRIGRFSDKRRFQPIQQNGINRSTVSNSKTSISKTKEAEQEEEEQKQPTNTNLPPPPPVAPSEIPVVIPTPPLPAPPPSSSSSIPEQTSPRLSSHSSSSSLSSLLKRQSKVAPPVVFLNKSIDVELNDVSFGFDMETSTIDKPSTPTPTSPPSPLPPTSTSEPSIDKDNHYSSSTKRSYPQRNIRSQPFQSSNIDTRPHQQRNYSPQSSSSSSSYVDPFVLLQYNQQRYQQLAYMNYFSTQYLPSQSSYVLIPTMPPPPSSSSFKTNSDDKDSSTEQIHEPLFVYTGLPGQNPPIYYPTNKKSFRSMYPSQYFYPATHPAYFQPISTSSVIDNKSQQDDTDHDDLLDDEEIEHDYEKSSTRLFHRTQQSSSAQIMSNALQLVYSQEKLQAQTDRFNLDQLTAYLAMKWTETVDHYEQGDDEILLTSE